MSALFSLVGATRQLGIPPDARLPVIPQLMDDFVASARQLDGWSSMLDERAAQAAFDHGFLVVIRGGDVLESPVVQTHLAKVSKPRP